MPDHLKTLIETFSKIPSREEFISAFKTATEFLKREVSRIEAKVDDKIARIKEGRDGRDGVDGKDGKDGAPGPRGEKGERGEPGPVGRAIFGARGADGKDGKDGSPDTPEQVRDKLETLKDDERLDVSAIKGLDKRFDDFRNTLPRGGGTSAIGVAQAFKYIAHTEEPSGAIDGANTSYTVKNNIWWIAGFTINGEQVAELPNFTYSGRTITFSSALPADYSGKDFEVKYIGT